MEFPRRLSLVPRSSFGGWNRRREEHGAMRPIPAAGQRPAPRGNCLPQFPVCCGTTGVTVERLWVSSLTSRVVPCSVCCLPRRSLAEPGPNRPNCPKSSRYNSRFSYIIPVILPSFRSITAASALRGNPGIVMISPVLTTTKPAPAERRTSRMWIKSGSSEPSFRA